MVKRIVFLGSLLILVVSAAAVIILLLNSADPVKAKKDNILKEFEGRTQLLEWSIKEIKTEKNKDVYYLVLFYNSLCRNCGSTKSLLWLRDNAPPFIKPVLVLHPSHKEHDLKNIRVNLDLPFDCLVPPKEMEKEWDDFEGKVLKARMIGIMYLVSGDGEILDKDFLPLVKEPFSRLMDIFFELAG